MELRLILAVAALHLCAQSALAHHTRYTADLTAADVSPGNNSPAIGHIVVTIDFDLVTMQVAAQFSGLAGTVMQAHIHAPTDEAFSGTAGIATQVPSLSGFPNSGTSGSYFQIFDMNQSSAYNPSFFAANGIFPSDSFNVLVNALDEGKAYFDIHTTLYPDGEIRGFLVHVPGDYNDNGIVDAADYVVWRHTNGETGEGLKADSNNDNVINDDDYTAWRENFGRAGLVAGSGTSLLAGVPEPSTFMLLAAGLGGFLLTHRRARI